MKPQAIYKIKHFDDFDYNVREVCGITCGESIKEIMKELSEYFSDIYQIEIVLNDGIQMELSNDNFEKLKKCAKEEEIWKL